jgi:hypothetical protein
MNKYIAVVVAALAALTCWVGASVAQSVDSALRTAYLEVFTQANVAVVARTVANECNPAGASAYGQALEAWERQHKVGAPFRAYASKVLSPSEMKATQIQEREEIIPKVRQAFATCPSPLRFNQMLASRDFDLTNSKPSSMAKVQEAMQKAGLDATPAAQASLAVAAPAETTSVVSVMATQSMQIGANGTMTAETDFLVVFSDNLISSDLNRIYGSGSRKPTQWGKFLREGELLKVTWESGTKETIKPGAMYKMLPASKAMTLSGQYRVLEADGGVAAGTGFEFFDDGRFTSGTTGGARRATGTYSINGYAIEFKPQSGPIDRQLFYVVPNQLKGQLGQIGIGGLRLVQRN